MNTENTNKANQIEAVAAEKTVVLIELTDAQVNALKLLDKYEERDEMAISCLRSRIKGAMDAKVKGLEKACAANYDSLARTVKLPISKDDYIKQTMSEARSLLREL
jgi:hypothetical protein